MAGEGQNAAWGWCMHGNWWFLPWHRGYLYFFERIVRKISGDDSFRLRMRSSRVQLLACGGFSRGQAQFLHPKVVKRAVMFSGT